MINHSGKKNFKNQCVCVCVCVCVYRKSNHFSFYQKLSQFVNQLNFNLKKKKKQNIYFGVKWMGILTPAPSLII